MGLGMIGNSYLNKPQSTGNIYPNVPQSIGNNNPNMPQSYDYGSEQECQTCKNRKYVDGSDDANVSFKNAAHVSPEAAASAVRAHEGQHVSNAYNRAATDDAKVVRASVRIHTSICPECGRTYVSGGVTDTQIKYYNESNPYQQDLKQTDGMRLRGSNVDYRS